MGPEAVSVEHPLNEVEVELVFPPQRVLLGLYSDFPFGLRFDRIHLVRFKVCTVKQEGHTFGVVWGTRWEQRSEHQSKRIGNLLVVFKDTLVFPRRVLDLRAFLSKDVLKMFTLLSLVFPVASSGNQTGPAGCLQLRK